ncbi:phosphoglucosamine mutase [Spirulina subsalsa]|uniref:phosphoglucosamine mutase n=1 Tax=Spirulina subsalsa TaxID=54311 RepID=UPI0002FCAC3C|nr:phosphoglucosamine mutase [Spirulina subsalsa]
MVTSPVRIQGSNPVHLPQTLESLRHGPRQAYAGLPKTPLFGTDGIRGKVGELLTASLALEVGFWAGQLFKATAAQAGPVILGQDSRNSSDMLSTALTAGLTTAGLEVWNLGLCPTPCVSFLTAQTGAMGGVMISASHNPPEDNGIKFFGANGTKLSKEAAKQIEAGLRGELGSPVTMPHHWGQYHSRPRLIQRYQQALQESLPPNLDFRGLRIVLDLAWGASVYLAPAVFRALGAEVICLHEQPDGDRINVNCGSTHLALLQEAVQRHQADLGFAFDGDADRVMAMDSQGREVNGDYILYFWGQELQNKQQLPDQLIVATVMANLGFERAWEQRGGRFLRTAVGDQHVQAAMFETGAMLGGEQSGHILCHHHSFSGDGLQTALHLTALVKQAGVTLSELVEESFRPYPQLLRNVRVEDRDRRLHWQDCDLLTYAIAQAEKELGDQGRILVRASGTEPLIRVMVEAAELNVAEYWTNNLVQKVQQYLAV